MATLLDIDPWTGPRIDRPGFPDSLKRFEYENHFVALGTDVTLIWNEEIIISATLISLSFIISTSVKKPIR